MSLSDILLKSFSENRKKLTENTKINHFLKPDRATQRSSLDEIAVSKW